MHYEEVKEKLRTTMRKKQHLVKRKEKIKARQNFLKDPHKFAKSLFSRDKEWQIKMLKARTWIPSKGNLQQSKMKWRASKHERTEKPSQPGIPFDMWDIKAKEVNHLVRKVCAKSSPGNDGTSYKVYKKCLLVRSRLFLLLQEA